LRAHHTLEPEIKKRSSERRCSGSDLPMSES
jgi:hypothetical protein